MYVPEQEREVIVVADLPDLEKENVEISLDYPRTDRDIVRENGMKMVERARDRYRVVRTSDAICSMITHTNMGRPNDRTAATFEIWMLEVHC